VSERSSPDHRIETKTRSKKPTPRSLPLLLIGSIQVTQPQAVW
jgi:hypothetical protein